MSIRQSTINDHRRQLQAWIEEYTLDRKLRASDPEQIERSDCSGTGVLSSKMGNKTFYSEWKEKNAVEPVSSAMNADSHPAPGQIRLLAPVIPSLPEQERPVFVLLAESTKDEFVTVVPFSRYPIPATPQEWRTGLRKRPLRVLCLWNLRVCRKERLASSWFVTTITPAKRSTVADMVQTMNDINAYTSRQFGPPLIHPLDPRHVYLQEERMLLDDFFSIVDETGQGTILEYPRPTHHASLVRAAETQEDYGQDGESGPLDGE